MDRIGKLLRESQVRLAGFAPYQVDIRAIRQRPGNRLIEAGTDPEETFHRALTGTEWLVDRIDIRCQQIGGFGIGRGPVYPGLPDGFFMALRDQQYGSKWFGARVFWFALPSYRVRFLARNATGSPPNFAMQPYRSPPTLRKETAGSREENT